MRALLLPLLVPLALGTACAKEDPQPAGLTADDQAELNDAAAMLDANAVDLNEVTQNEAQP